MMEEGSRPLTLKRQQTTTKIPRNDQKRTTEHQPFFCLPFRAQNDHLGWKQPHLVTLVGACKGRFTLDIGLTSEYFRSCQISDVNKLL